MRRRTRTKTRTTTRTTKRRTTIRSAGRRFPDPKTAMKLPNLAKYKKCCG